MQKIEPDIEADMQQQYEETMKKIHQFFDLKRNLCMAEIDLCNIFSSFQDNIYEMITAATIINIKIKKYGIKNVTLEDETCIKKEKIKMLEEFINIKRKKRTQKNLVKTVNTHEMSAEDIISLIITLSEVFVNKYVLPNNPVVH